MQASFMPKMARMKLQSNSPLQPYRFKTNPTISHRLPLQRHPIATTTFRPRSRSNLPPLVGRPSDPEAAIQCQHDHRLGSPQAAHLALQGLELWNLSQGRQRHRAFATPSKVSVIGVTALGQHRRQGCQGSPDPTASRIERKPCRSSCSSKPSRIRGTKSGP